MEDMAEAYRTHRPFYHFSARKGWINDPNGLVFNDGWYHLFYQYYPDGICHGAMHWGHARTRDFLMYEDLPVALYPDKHGEIFSGSAVMDRHNSAGFGENGKVPMIAAFTHHQQNGESVVQSQSIAASLDGGLTFTPYEGNPVIVAGMRDFRDPKVFWYEKGLCWVMAVVAGRCVMFYSSTDLINWRHCSTFTTPNPEPAGIWECPDLLCFETGEGEKWVLIVSVNSGAGNAFGMQYFVGTFDGETFTAQTPSDEVCMMDFGLDHYAAVTYNGLDDRVVLSGWMSCWFYAEALPADGFRGAMTIPRELSLIHTVEGAYRLAQKPVRELWDAAIPCEHFPKGPAVVEIETEGKSCRIILSNGREPLVISHDAERKSVTIDRAGCFPLENHDLRFDRMEGCYSGESCKSITLLLDTTSVELFAADGLLAGTVQCFPAMPFDEIRVEGIAGKPRYYRVNARCRVDSSENI